MDQVTKEARGDARPQHDLGNGRQSPQNSHSQDPHGALQQIRPLSQPHPQQRHSTHWKRPSSNNLHSRSMDPTGMFRNRGRRIIAGSRGTSVQNTGTIPSPSPSPPKSNASRVHHDYPLVRSEEFYSNADQQDHLQAQQEYRTGYDHARTASSAHPEMHSQSRLPEELMQSLSTAPKSLKMQPLHSTEERSRQPQDNPNNICVRKTDNKLSSERITEEVDPEEDRPPQSLTRGPNSGGYAMQRDGNQNKAKKTESEKNHIQNKGSDENIMINHSHDSGDSDQGRSNVGSTVSIMGSIAGEGDHSSTFDEARLVAVKRRMMQDVAEVLEEEGEEASDFDVKNSDISSKDNNSAHRLEETTDSGASYENTLNISLECNADTDTSLLDDTICDVTPQDWDPQNIDSHQYSPNLVKVADFSHLNGVGAKDKNTINKKEGPKRDEQSTNDGQESPFRAAFRRSAQGMSNHLPPLSSQMMSAAFLPQLARQCFSFEDTTHDDEFFAMPDQLHLGEGAHPASHKYYGLSAVASFSTGDHDDSQTIGIQSTDISLKRNAPPKWHPSPRTRLPHHKPTSPFRIIRHSQTWGHHGQSPIYENKNMPQYLHGSVRQTSSFDPRSPPSAGRKSSESGWNKHDRLLGNNSDREVNFVQAGNRDSEEKDWKKIETERGDAIDLLACMIEQSLKFNQPESKGSPDFLCEKCCGTRDKESNHHFSCNDCLENVKRVTNSLKEISNKSPDDDHPSNFDHQTRSDVIDALLLSYEFSLVAKQSSLSANKWLESIGWEKKNIASENTDGCNQPLDVVALRARLHSAESVVSSKQSEISRLNEELSKCKAEIGRLKICSSRTEVSHRQAMSVSTNKSILSNSSSDDAESDSLVLCSPRPTVKRTESNDDSFLMWEKNIERQMNLECRKEILFLKAQLEKAKRKIATKESQVEEPFTSDIEPIKASDDGTEQLFMKIAEDIENEAMGSPVTDEGADQKNNGMYSIPGIIKLNDPALEKELEEYRAALIMSLDAEGNGRRSHADSISSNEDPNLAQEMSKSNSSEAASDRKMINVRMLNGENFSTEWGDLVDLPPPPDHSLNSPIVDAILSKWTDDTETQSSLLVWMDNLLNGSDADSVPSLKLSGLDHQIRDGFVMHVLPLLLRRKDIQVHLTSRAHRVTTYDIAVTITPTSFGVNNSEHDGLSDAGSEDPELQQRQIRESKHHMMAFQATKSGASIKENNDVPMSSKKQIPILTKTFLGASVPGLVRSASNAGSINTAITSPISNRTPSRGPHAGGRNRYTSLSSEMKRDHDSSTHDEYALHSNLLSNASASLGDDLSVGSSVEDDTDSKHSQRQSSIMGSISGAFGLLSRRKSPMENEFQSNAPNINGPHVRSSMFQTPKREAGRSNPRSSNEKEHPYHRVVSAPPGKIGITFVEYRGHAVVSSVSDDSPLVGWVFPSDVLIAIDDVPVSGLRTRDIVKLLTNRVGQHRNLRMISAVAMNEITRPGTV